VKEYETPPYTDFQNKHGGVNIECLIHAV